MSRLTDEELAALLSNARQNDSQVEKWLDLKRSVALLEDLIECRAALALESTALKALMEEHDEVCADRVRMIRERRAADLSDEDRQGLEFAKARVLFNMNASAASEYFSDGYVDRHLHAVAVLDRLLSHAGGDK